MSILLTTFSLWFRTRLKLRLVQQTFYASHKQTVVWSKMFCKSGTLKHSISSLTQLSIQHTNRQNRRNSRHETVSRSNTNPQGAKGVGRPGGCAPCWQEHTNKTRVKPDIPTKSYTCMSTSWLLGIVYTAKSCKGKKRVPDALKSGLVS